MYIYPIWAVAIGWIMALTPMFLIPGYFIWYLLKKPGTLSEVSNKTKNQIKIYGYI